MTCAYDLVELTTAPLYEGSDFVTMDELIGCRRADDDRNVDEVRQVLEKSAKRGNADSGPDEHNVVRRAGVMSECSVWTFDSDACCRS